MSTPWLLADERGSAATLHAASEAALDEGDPRRRVRVLRASAPALVVGSNQSEAVFDPAAIAAAGLEVARRRSGGSAVIVGPGEVLWVDFVLPAGDRLADADVGRAAWWVGEVWAGALSTAGVADDAEVWKGPMRRTAWSDAVCFAGLGAGEVTIGARKVVGVAQRRRIGATLFQTAALLRWEPSRYVDLLRAAPPGADPAGLSDSAQAIGAGTEEPIVAALLEQLALLP